MRSFLALSVPMALVACAEQQPKQDPAPEKQDAAPEQIGIDNSLAARLAKSDPTVCNDKAVQRLVVLKTLTELDQQAAEKYQLLLANGGSLEFVGARMTGAKPEISQVTCSAALHPGFSDKPFRFTYALRPDDTGSEVIVDPKGRVARWYHFRGAVVSKLAGMGLLEAPKPLEPKAELEPETELEPQAEPEPEAEPEPQTEPLPVPYELPSENPQQVPMNGAAAESDGP